DVNGDGYSDLIGGAPTSSPTLASEGGIFQFNGNQSRSLDRRTRQYLTDLVTPLSTNSNDFSNILFFGIGHRSRNPIQRSKVKLRWEVVFEGMAFTGAPITNSLGFSAMSPTWTDVGTAGLELKQIAAKAPTHLRYKWRVREEYPLAKLIDGQRFSRWFYGYAPSLGDIGILPIELIDFRGEAIAEGNKLEWTAASSAPGESFVVERSRDGLVFDRIGALDAEPGANAVEHTFLDRTPPSGLSYYRLQLMNALGDQNRSEQIALVRDQGTFTVYPNPATDLLTWTRSESAARVVVRDALGQTALDQRTQTGANSITIERLPAGHYSLELMDTQGATIAHSRFIKAQAPMVR
ncbi:MAG TPA: T9SS type A sorting domain-containing protein, partial [Flavobacteriales bacterium]|nr:T9SS type A sorting domain-containing protein [Flavobacteriales bacterium]